MTSRLRIKPRVFASATLDKAVRSGLFLLLALGVQAVLAGSVTYTYDPSGRLVGADFGGGKSITYSYDNAGNLIQRLTVATPVDTTPAPFAFIDVSDAARSAALTSNEITVSAINSPAAIAITACMSTLCEYSINGAGFTGLAGTVSSGDTVRVRQTSSASFATRTDLTLDISGVSDVFSVTTLAADTTPAPFAFDPASGVAPGTAATSNVITVTGINTGAPISITACASSNCAYSINGGGFVDTPGTVGNNDLVQVRQTASPDLDTLTRMTLSIGGVLANFDVTTEAGTCYTLLTSAQPNGAGHVNASLAPNCGNGSRYAAGTVVQLGAVSEYGYVFDHWSGAATGALNPLSLLMDGDKTLTANFAFDSATPGQAAAIPTLDIWGGGILVGLIGLVALLALRSRPNS